MAHGQHRLCQKLLSFRLGQGPSPDSSGLGLFFIASLLLTHPTPAPRRSPMSPVLASPASLGQALVPRPAFSPTRELDEVAVEAASERPTLLRHRYQLDEPPTMGLTQQIHGIDMRASQRNCKVLVYHLVEEEEYRSFTRLLKALKSPYVANCVECWCDDHGEGWIVVERGGIRLDEYLDEVEALTDATRSAVLESVTRTLFFLYQNGYIAHIQAASFMQFGDTWRMVDLFDCLYPIEDVDDPAQRDLFVLAQGGLAQGLVEGTFSVLQLPAFASVHLGLIAVEMLLSSSLLSGHRSEVIYEMVLVGPREEDGLNEEELQIVSALQIILLGYHGRCSFEEAVVALGVLLQDHIFPSFKASRHRLSSGKSPNMRHYYSKF